MEENKQEVHTTKHEMQTAWSRHWKAQLIQSKVLSQL